MKGKHVEEVKSIAKILEDLGILTLKKAEFHLPSWVEHYSRIFSILDSLSFENPILDIGLGYGVVTLYLSGKGFKVIATEHPTIFRKELKDILDNLNVDVVFNRLEEGLPFRDRSFSLIVFCDVIEHLKGEVVEMVLGEMYRCLKEKGYVVLSTPNLARFSNILRLALGRGINPPIVPEKIGGVYGHVREFCFQELEHLLKKVGFKIEKIHYGVMKDFIMTSRKPIKEIVYKVERLIFPLIKRWGDEIYLVLWK